MTVSAQFRGFVYGKLSLAGRAGKRLRAWVTKKGWMLLDENASGNGSLDRRKVPSRACYRIQTQRAIENYPISGHRAITS